MSELNSLLLISPLPTAGSAKQPLESYYRLFGGRTCVGGLVVLEYLRDLLTPPVQCILHHDDPYLQKSSSSSAPNTAFSKELLQPVALESLDAIVQSLGRMQGSEYDLQDSAVLATVQNYYAQSRVDRTITELTCLFACYQRVVEKAYSGTALTEQDLRWRDEFLRVITFFHDLEQRYFEHHLQTGTAFRSRGFVPRV